MTNFEAIIKSLIWRFLIAVPLGMVVAYFYTNDFGVSMEITIAVNIYSTVLYYLFDIIWFGKINKHFKGDDDT